MRASTRLGADRLFAVENAVCSGGHGQRPQLPRPRCRSRCSLSDTNSHFFLAGVFNVSGMAECTITVPAGKALFFPILNTVWDNNCASPPLTVDELYAGAASYVATTTELHASLDGVPLKSLFDYRVTVTPGKS